jgi:hypothetical protein
MGLSGWPRLNEHFTSQAHQQRVAAAVRCVLARRREARGAIAASTEEKESL